MLIPWTFNNLDHQLLKFWIRPDQTSVLTKSSLHAKEESCQGVVDGEPDMQFEEIGNKKKSIQIATQILKAIGNGRFQAGDRLPPEEEIARMTGTSRPSVREALGALQIVGVLETKAGSGTFVRKSIGGPEIESQLTELLTGERIGLFEMIEARQMVERGCAGYVIKNLRKGDLNRIKNCVIRMQEAIEKSDWDGYRSANQRFHSCMIGVTRNRIIEEIYRSFLDPSRSELWKRMNMWLNHAPRKIVMRSLREHQNLLSALENKDREMFLQRLDEHIEGTVERLRLTGKKR